MKNSAEKMAWLSMLSQQKITDSAFKVAFVLANRQNCKTGQCDPSISTIIEDSGCSKNTVKTAISSIRKLGFLEIEKGHGGSRIYPF